MKASNINTFFIDFSNFKVIYKHVLKWKQVFQAQDENQSATVEFNEFSKALSQLGFELPSDLSEFVFNKYSTASQMKFDAFIESVLVIIALTKVFEKYDCQKRGVAEIPYFEFMKDVFDILENY